MGASIAPEFRVRKRQGLSKRAVAGYPATMLGYLLVALALAADAFAVSVSSGICAAELRFRHALRAASAFGLSQALMPLAGYLAAGALAARIQAFDHWIAFGLLAFIGARMIAESFGVKDDPSCDDEEVRRHDIRSLRMVLIMAVATSVDAAAVGASYALVNAPIVVPAAVIGCVTFVLSLAGIEFGKRLGARFERGAEIAGGLVLVGLGFRILLEHLLA